MVTFRSDLSKPATHLPHFWERVVGSGHAPLALRADWQQQLQRCRRELGFEYVRFHGLLSDPMSMLLQKGDELIYAFFNADQIVDFLLSIGMRPFVELSFMPKALASGEKTVFSYASNVTPPRDYAQWGALIGKLARHWVNRYGLTEVRHWFFEVWNEPNLEHFWTGTQDDYFKLYRYAVEAIKEVDPSLRVGGPATAQNEWLEPFLDFCEREGLPADFVTTHYYPTDAFGKTDTATEEKLANASPDVMAERAREAQQMVRGLPLYYTEWNIASNPRHELHDQPFAAASAMNILMSVAGHIEGYSYWTFSDIFEELNFPSQPFHGGFGLLTLHGVAKPVYRAFQLLHDLGDEQLSVHGEHPTVRCWLVRKEGEVTALLINHAPPRQPLQSERVEIRLANAQTPRSAVVRRVDEDHANARRAWEEMGKPGYLDQHQVSQLKIASQLQAEPVAWEQTEDGISLSLTLPPQGVAAVTLDFAAQEYGK